MRLKQSGDAIEALLSGGKSLARQVGIQQRKALEGRKGSRAEALPSEPEANACGKVGEGGNSKVGAIHGSRGRRCCCRAFTQDTCKELWQREVRGAWAALRGVGRRRADVSTGGTRGIRSAGCG